VAANGESKGGGIVSGALVLVVAIGFAAYAGATQRAPMGDSVTMHGRFASANGLHVGANVALSGVIVGRVEGIFLDSQSDLARVDFTVPRSLHLPADTTLGIASPTMTADNALTINPGKSTTVLPIGATISRTTDQVSLEQQVSDYIFGGGTLGN